MTEAEWTTGVGDDTTELRVLVSEETCVQTRTIIGSASEKHRQGYRFNRFLFCLKNITAECADAGFCDSVRNTY